MSILIYVLCSYDSMKYLLTVCSKLLFSKLPTLKVFFQQIQLARANSTRQEWFDAKIFEKIAFNTE